MALRNTWIATAVRWMINFRGQRKEISRRCLFAALRRVTPAVAVDTGGLRLFLSTSDLGVSRTTFSRGLYERDLFVRVIGELDRIGQPSLAGRIFLDVGANIGTATCQALVHHGMSRSWAFEPAPENLQLLRQNILVNGLDQQVSVRACAASDHDGAITFELSPTNWGDHRVRASSGAVPSAMADEAGRASVEVAARRLDHFVECGELDLENVGLAWIDVQGHEAHVLSGASALMRSSVPIVCEYWPYGLGRMASLERLHKVIACGRARFIDLNRPGSRPQPTATLPTLAGRYEGGIDFTDLLLLPDG